MKDGYAMLLSNFILGTKCDMEIYTKHHSSTCDSKLMNHVRERKQGKGIY